MSYELLEFSEQIDEHFEMDDVPELSILGVGGDGV